MNPTPSSARCAKSLLAVALMLGMISTASAADKFWSKTNGGSFNTNNSWTPAGIPGATDNTIFASNATYDVTWSVSATNANAYFDAVGGTVTMDVGTIRFWLLTNSFVVGRSAGSTAAVTHATGTLRVTNAAGTARMVIGQNGTGTFNLNGGSVVADQLFVTNNGPGFTNSIFNFNHGNLTTLNGSTIVVSSNDFLIGNSNGQTATWLISGGTNTITVGTNRSTWLGIGEGTRGVVTVTGSGTAWSNSGELWLGLNGASNALVVSNGAAVFNRDGRIGGAFFSSNNSVVVTGVGSLWSNSGALFVGAGVGRGNLLVISNGGSVVNQQSGQIGSTSLSSNNVALVTGAGSVWSNRLSLAVGFAGSSNALVVSSGGLVAAPSIIVGDSTNALNNLLTVTGGSLVGTNANGTALFIGRDGQGTLNFNGGTILASQLFVTNNGPGFTNSIFNFNYGDLTTFNGSVVVQSKSIIIGNTSNQTATWLISGGTNTIALGAGNDTILGNIAGSRGVVNVTNGATVWSNSGSLTVGRNGQGTLNLNGGTIVASQLLVTNNGPGFTNSIFNFNYGDLTTLNGSVIAQSNDFIIGNTSNQTATWLISGGANMITASGLNAGTLLGSGNGRGVVTVTGGGTLWSNSGTLSIESSSRLIVSNGATVVVDREATLSSGTISSNNSVWVTGAGSLWTNNLDLIVGKAGAGNWLVVSNAGQLVNSRGVVGNAGSSSNNVVVVTGLGSVWSNRNGLTIGTTGSVNTVIITNSGAIATPSVIIGSNAAALNNVLTVAGGSLIGTFGNGTALTVGKDGQGTLNFNGGTIAANQLFVTNNGSGFTNSIFNFNHGDLTTLNGSTISQSNDFIIGNASNLTATWLMQGGTNTIALGVTGNIILGSAPGSRGVVNVTNGTTIWSNSGSLTVGRDGQGTLNFNGGTIVASQVFVTNNGPAFTNSIFNFNYGGLTTVNGSTIAQSSDFIIGNTSNQTASWLMQGGTNTIGLGASGNTILGNVAGSRGVVDVSNGATVWSNSGSLTVGRNGQGTLNFNGGTIVASQLFVTNNGPDITNSIFNFNYGDLTTLNGSVIVQSNDFIIGNTSNQTATWLISGGTNTIVLDAGSNTVLGSSSGSRGIVTVTGSGTTWSNSGVLTVGSSNALSALVVTNGGRVLAAGLVVGDRSTGSNNVVTVTGSNSVVGLASNAIIGALGSGNQLFISGGGMVSNITGIIGGNSASANANNSVILADGGSSWFNSNELLVGQHGSNHLLVVSNGAQVISAVGTIGENISARGNTALVTGSGSVWTNSDLLSVGSIGSFNRLVVSDGAKVITDYGIIGGASVSTNNEVWVAGVSSLWSNRVELRVGDAGTGNRLFISNGGSVFSRVGSVGYASANNLALVTDAGSVWNSTSNIYVGRSGFGNLLIVSNGGMVFDRDGRIGGFSSGSNDEAQVTGAGSLWSNSASLIVGDGGSGNRLTISSGGRAVDQNGVFGAFATSSNNQVLVTDAGSLWSNRSSLFIGSAGSCNTLTISNNGVVTVAASAHISWQSGASNNVLTVAGGTLVVTNSFGTSLLTVGESGQGTLNFNGGMIVASQLFVTNNGPGFTNSIFNFNHGDLTTLNGSTITQSNDFIIGNTSNQTATWLISGGTNNIALGMNRATLLGNAAGSRAVVTVSGSSTVWSNSWYVNVGASGSSSRLTITNGGRVLSAAGTIGLNTGSTNNEVRLSGTNSLWSNSFGFLVGVSGSGNRLVVSRGASLVSSAGNIGYDAPSRDNMAWITDPGSLWKINSDLHVGDTGPGNWLVVSNGARVTDGTGTVGFIGTASSNTAWITGAGSVWTNSGDLQIGSSGAANLLVVSNGAQVFSFRGLIGRLSSSSNNLAIVTGVGSEWNNSVLLAVGEFGGSGNTLVVSTGGLVTAPSILAGYSSNALNNVLTVAGGTLLVTNAAGDALLELGRNGQGTLNFNGGTIVASQLFVTNGANSVFNFNAGTLNVRTTVVANTQPFFVGNGVSNATMNLVGSNGTHSFGNGLTIRTNAALTGNGTIFGSVTNYGTISLGNSPGAITINGDLRLLPSSRLTFEIGGLIATNDYDQLTVTNFIEFAGTLSLSLLNDFLPDSDDTFTLFKFGSASGAFSNVTASRVSLTNNLASFAVTSTGANLVLGGAQYVDSDGDGQGDLQELAAGTNPNDPSSALTVLSITRNGSGQNVVRFQSVSGKNYRVEYSNDLVTWSVATMSVPAIAATTQWTDDGTHPGGLPGIKRFYRIGLQ